MAELRTLSLSLRVGDFLVIDGGMVEVTRIDRRDGGRVDVRCRFPAEVRVRLERREGGEPDAGQAPERP